MQAPPSLYAEHCALSSKTVIRNPDPLFTLFKVKMNPPSLAIVIKVHF
jgi:hypothetical protein